MSAISQNIKNMVHTVTKLEQQYQRAPGSVSLLAVSKTRPASDILQAVSAGQRQFGESYLQEALDKIETLRGYELVWHFIGPIQSNKTRPIAGHFDWVHSVERLKIAQRLSAQRPEHLPPLNICLQVNVSQDPNKAGCDPDEVFALAGAVASLPGLKLRGLMTIPVKTDSFDKQRQPFQTLRQLFEQLQQSGYPLDTLSMGMTGDMEAAIAEGSTIVRVGTGIFGARTK
jgi:pyridoxal phosphate enzyme (YggS family)